MKFLIVCFMNALFLFIPIKESLHIYQQNRYQMGRYRTWLKEQCRYQQMEILRMFIMFLPFFGLCLVPEQHYPSSLYIILLLVYSYIIWKLDMEHVYIQKIKYTHRIKRFLIAEFLCYFICFVCLFYYGSIRWLIAVTPFLFFSPWLMLQVVGIIMHPIEQKIRYHYVKEAKKMLKDREDLIKVGITGSYGKTSVKNILHTLLSDHYYTLMTPHSYNNLMGLTISIRSLLTSLHEVFLAEMGADHVAEIQELAEFIQPTIAIITAIGPQHIETFGTQENILKEKMRLIENLPADGTAILNYDNEWIRSYKIQNECKVITYGIHQENLDVRAMDIVYSPQGSTFKVKVDDDMFMISTCLLGEHNVLNILAAICAAKVLHIESHEIAMAMKKLQYVEHRLEVRKMYNYTLLDDAYNSNPQGASYALDVLSQMPGVRYLVTPGFLDLGGMKKEAHQTYAKQMVDHTDVIILVGEKQTRDIFDTLVKEGYPLDDIYIVYTTHEAFELLNRIVKNGDTVLIENDLPDAFNH